MSWQTEVDQAITGLGYELVEIERSAGGLLRVYIEYPQGVPAITVDDCERVTRQLQYLLEVQEVDYQRLEVSSAGLDRLLKNEQDLERFLGYRIEVTFQQSVDIVADDGKTAYKQKRFEGRLEHALDEQPGWVLVLESEPNKTKKKTNSKKAVTQEPAMALGFMWNEVREARLVPVVDFKGKKVIADSQLEPETQAVADQSIHNNGDRNG